VLGEDVEQLAVAVSEAVESVVFRQRQTDAGESAGSCCCDAVLERDGLKDRSLREHEHGQP
jgi:hypothetical protein